MGFLDGADMQRLLIAAALLMALPSAGVAQSVRALTAPTLSPFSHEAGDTVPGFNVELMRLAADRAGIDLVIEWVPWKRAQAVVAGGEGLLLFGATRTAAREDRYDWIANLVTVERVFVTTGLAVDTFEAASDLEHIGARSVYLRALQARGFENLEEATTDANFRKLRAGRIDAVFTVSARAVYNWTERLGFPGDAITIGRPVASSDIWLAASPGFDPAVASRLAAAIGDLHRDRTYADLHARYFGSLPILTAPPAGPSSDGPSQAGSGG